MDLIFSSHFLEQWLSPLFSINFWWNIFISLLFTFFLLVPTLNKHLLLLRNFTLLIRAFVLPIIYVNLYPFFILLEALYSFCKRQNFYILCSPKSIKNLSFPRKTSAEGNFLSVELLVTSMLIVNFERFYQTAL